MQAPYADSYLALTRHLPEDMHQYFYPKKCIRCAKMYTIGMGTGAWNCGMHVGRMVNGVWSCCGVHYMLEQQRPPGCVRMDHSDIMHRVPPVQAVQLPEELHEFVNANIQKNGNRSEPGMDDEPGFIYIIPSDTRAYREHSCTAELMYLNAISAAVTSAPLPPVRVAPKRRALEPVAVHWSKRRAMDIIPISMALDLTSRTLDVVERKLPSVMQYVLPGVATVKRIEPDESSLNVAFGPVRNIELGKEHVITLNTDKTMMVDSTVDGIPSVLVFDSHMIPILSTMVSSASGPIPVAVPVPNVVEYTLEDGGQKFYWVTNTPRPIYICKTPRTLELMPGEVDTSSTCNVWRTRTLDREEAAWVIREMMVNGHFSSNYMPTSNPADNVLSQIWKDIKHAVALTKVTTYSTRKKGVFYVMSHHQMLSSLGGDWVNGDNLFRDLLALPPHVLSQDGKQFYINTIVHRLMSKKLWIVCSTAWDSYNDHTGTSVTHISYVPEKNAMSAGYGMYVPDYRVIMNNLFSSINKINVDVNLFSTTATTQAYESSLGVEDQRTSPVVRVSVIPNGQKLPDPPEGETSVVLPQYDGHVVTALSFSNTTRVTCDAVRGVTLEHNANSVDPSYGVVVSARVYSVKGTPVKETSLVDPRQIPFASPDVWWNYIMLYIVKSNAKNIYYVNAMIRIERSSLSNKGDIVLEIAKEYKIGLEHQQKLLKNAIGDASRNGALVPAAAIESGRQNPMTSDYKDALMKKYTEQLEECQSIIDNNGTVEAETLTELKNNLSEFQNETVNVAVQHGVFSSEVGEKFKLLSGVVFDIGSAVASGMATLVPEDTGLQTEKDIFNMVGEACQDVGETSMFVARAIGAGVLHVASTGADAAKERLDKVLHKFGEDVKQIAFGAYEVVSSDTFVLPEPSVVTNTSKREEARCLIHGGLLDADIDMPHGVKPLVNESLENKVKVEFMPYSVRFPVEDSPNVSWVDVTAQCVTSDGLPKAATMTKSQQPPNLAARVTINPNNGKHSAMFQLEVQSGSFEIKMEHASQKTINAMATNLASMNDMSAGFTVGNALVDPAGIRPLPVKVTCVPIMGVIMNYVVEQMIVINNGGTIPHIDVTAYTQAVSLENAAVRAGTSDSKINTACTRTDGVERTYPLKQSKRVEKAITEVAKIGGVTCTGGTSIIAGSKDTKWEMGGSDHMHLLVHRPDDTCIMFIAPTGIPIIPHHLTDPENMPVHVTGTHVFSGVEVTVADTATVSGVSMSLSIRSNPNIQKPGSLYWSEAFTQGPTHGEMTLVKRGHDIDISSFLGGNKAYHIAFQWYKDMYVKSTDLYYIYEEAHHGTDVDMKKIKDMATELCKDVDVMLEWYQNQTYNELEYNIDNLISFMTEKMDSILIIKQAATIIQIFAMTSRYNSVSRLMETPGATADSSDMSVAVDSIKSNVASVENEIECNYLRNELSRAVRQGNFEQQVNINSKINNLCAPNERTVYISPKQCSGEYKLIAVVNGVHIWGCDISVIMQEDKTLLVADGERVEDTIPLEIESGAEISKDSEALVKKISDMLPIDEVGALTTQMSGGVIKFDGNVLVSPDVVISDKPIVPEPGGSPGFTFIPPKPYVIARYVDWRVHVIKEHGVFDWFENPVSGLEDKHEPGNTNMMVKNVKDTLIIHSNRVQCDVMGDFVYMQKTNVGSPPPPEMIKFDEEVIKYITMTTITNIDTNYMVLTGKRLPLEHKSLWQVHDIPSGPTVFSRVYTFDEKFTKPGYVIDPFDISNKHKVEASIFDPREKSLDVDAIDLYIFKRNIVKDMDGFNGTDQIKNGKLLYKLTKTDSNLRRNYFKSYRFSSFRENVRVWVQKSITFDEPEQGIRFKTGASCDTQSAQGLKIKLVSNRHSSFFDRLNPLHGGLGLGLGVNLFLTMMNIQPDTVPPRLEGFWPAYENMLVNKNDFRYQTLQLKRSFAFETQKTATDFRYLANQKIINTEMYIHHIVSDMHLVSTCDPDIVAVAVQDQVSDCINKWNEGTVI